MVFVSFKNFQYLYVIPQKFLSSLQCAFCVMFVSNALLMMRNYPEIRTNLWEETRLFVKNYHGLRTISLRAAACETGMEGDAGRRRGSQSWPGRPKIDMYENGANHGDLLETKKDKLMDKNQVPVVLMCNSVLRSCKYPTLGKSKNHRNLYTKNASQCKSYYTHSNKSRHRSNQRRHRKRRKKLPAVPSWRRHPVQLCSGVISCLLALATPAAAYRGGGRGDIDTAEKQLFDWYRVLTIEYSQLKCSIFFCLI